MKGRAKKYDSVSNPRHYNSHPAGIECIDVIEHMPYNIGAAIKYLWRCDLKHASADEDLNKALWYVRREIQKRERTGNGRRSQSRAR